MRRFRSHGTVPKPEHGGWYYEVETLGYNYRLTDLQAAFGSARFAKLDAFVARRNDLAARYRVLLAGLPIELPPAAPEGFRHAYHLFAVRVPERRAVYDTMRATGIGVQVHYVPIYKHPLYADPAAARVDYPDDRTGVRRPALVAAAPAAHRGRAGPRGRRALTEMRRSSQ